MDIKHLEYFIEIARYKSFSKAAEEIHISQPSLSKAIKDLEYRLGITLFYRNTLYLELTDSGEAILEQANQIVSSFQSIGSQLQGITELMTGKMRIGIPPITGVTSFARLFGLFKKKYPNINIQLFESGSKKIEQGLLDGSLDVGIICIPTHNENLYEVIDGIKDPLRVVMPPEHRLAKESVIDFSTLRDEPFILYSNDFILHEQILNRCKQAGFKINIIFETLQRELMTQLVADNFGIALLPSRICRELPPHLLKSTPLADPQFYLELGVAWKKGRYVSHATRAWLQFVKDNRTDITRDKWFWNNATLS